MNKPTPADHVFEAITAFLIAGMVVLTLLQVVTRYGMHGGFEWTEELARLDLIYLTFFGSVVALRRGQHLRIDTFVDLLPLRVRRVVRVAVNLVSVAVLVMVVWQGVPLLPRFWPVLSAALGWPTSFFYLPVVIGCLFMALFTLADLARVRDDAKSAPEAQDGAA